MNFRQWFHGSRRKTVFNSFWIGSRTLPPTAIACLNSFLERGHKVDLYCYHPIVNAPQAVNQVDAAKIIDNNILSSFEFAAQAADLFRYKLLHEVGGWWIDCDILCNTSSPPANTYVFAKEEYDEMICNAQLRFPKGDSVLRDAVDFCISADKNLAKWATFGPALINRIIISKSMSHLCSPTSDYYPIHWMESFKFLLPEFTPEIITRTRLSKFVHLYASMFPRFGFDENTQRPLKGSFLDIMYSGHRACMNLDDHTDCDGTLLRQKVAAYFAQPWVRNEAAGHKIQEFLGNMDPPLPYSQDQ